MERAAKRLQLVVPLTLFIIFMLLYFNFGNITEPLVVMLSIPFALIGGIWLIYWLNFNMSVAVGVGFIALAGVAAEIGALVLTFIDQEIARRRQSKSAALSPVNTDRLENQKTVSSDVDAQPVSYPIRLTGAEVMEAVHAGTSERVRPVMMTATATFAGLLPIMWGHGTGSEVMQRIAAPMVGGMVSVTLLSLLILPVIYGLVLQFQEKFQKTVENEQEIPAKSILEPT
jgi:Cu(I)/Ag(I) efflux system membrane protein CusA/SilA